MKKTLFALLALAGLATAGEELTPVWTSANLTMSGHAEYGITPGEGVTLNTTDGMTAYIIVNWTGVSNAPMLWFNNTDTTGYRNSVATLGYKGVAYHASLYSTSGSNAGASDGYYNKPGADFAEVTTPDCITTILGNTDKNDSLADKNLVYFMTTQGGTSMLYELMDDGGVQLISTQTGMKTGDIAKLYVGNWNNGDSAQVGTIKSIELYDTVLTTEQMKSLTPEPATATLSLLALAGLAARRRRH